MIKINLHACAAFVQALKFSIFHRCINGAAMSTSCQDDVATYQTLRTTSGVAAAFLDSHATFDTAKFNTLFFVDCRVFYCYTARNLCRFSVVSISAYQLIA